MGAIGDYAAGDWADRETDYGYGMGVHAQHFDRSSHLYTGPLAMRPIGDRCLCPACASEGWYATSPLCRFWRSECWECSGARRVWVHHERRRVACDSCAEAWPVAVAMFRDALRSPRRAAQRLRDQAARNAVEVTR